MARAERRLGQLGALVLVGQALLLRGVRITSSSGQAASANLPPRKGIAATVLPAYCSALHLLPPPAQRPLLGPPHADVGLRQARDRQAGRATTRMSGSASLDFEELVLREKVGKGNTGVVWRAKVVNNDDRFLLAETPEVAVKIMKGTTSRKRKGSKVKAAAASRPFPDAVSIFNGGQFLQTHKVWNDDEADYICMELADGDIRRMVLERPFEEVNLFQRLSILADLTKGLSLMNERGFAHTKVKPSNLLVKSSIEHGIPILMLKIGDTLSACRLGEEAKDQEADGQEDCDTLAFAKADLPYMSPEHVLCDRNKVEPDLLTKGDVFSVGILWYQMLFEGRLPLHYYTHGTWQGFDINEDPLLLTAIDMAGRETQKQWTLLLLTTVQMMLEKDVSKRLSAKEAFDIVTHLSAGHQAQTLLREASQEVGIRCADFKH